MNEYHKIQSVYFRDEKNNFKTFLEGQWSEPAFGYLKDNVWVWTEKIDGTNIRVMWNGKDITFGGKTDNAQIPAFLVNRLNDLFEGTKGRKKMRDVFGEEGEVCLYGEGYGAKIQKGGGNYIPDNQDFILFDVNIGGIWLERKNVEDIATKFDIGIVPIVGEGTLEEAIKLVKKGYDSLIGKRQAEGLVMKPKTELLTRRGHRVITKVKHKDFAEKLMTKERIKHGSKG